MPEPKVIEPVIPPVEPIVPSVIEPVIPPVEPPVEPPANEKTFTQTELNAINLKEKNKVYKSMGYKDEDEYKAAKQKHEDDLGVAEKLALKETDYTTALTRAEKAEAQLSVLSAGIPAKKAEKAVKLAATYDGETMDAKIAAMLVEYPEFKSNGGTAFGNPPGAPGGETKEQRLEKIFKASLTS